MKRFLRRLCCRLGWHRWRSFGTCYEMHRMPVVGVVGFIVAVDQCETCGVGVKLSPYWGRVRKTAEQMQELRTAIEIANIAGEPGHMTTDDE